MFRSKREVLSTISKQETVSKSGKHYTIFCAYLGKNPVTGKYVRFAKSSRNELESAIRKFYEQMDLAFR